MPLRYSRTHSSYPRQSSPTRPTIRSFAYPPWPDRLLASCKSRLGKDTLSSRATINNRPVEAKGREGYGRYREDWSHDERVIFLQCAAIGVVETCTQFLRGIANTATQRRGSKVKSTVISIHQLSRVQ